MDIPADYEALKQLFESIEPGSSASLDKFLAEAAYKYEVGINKLVHKPGQTLTEFLDWEVMTGVFKLDVFNSMKSHVAKYFSHPKLKELMEFPVLFLGALPEKIPALYSLMNYADIKGGTWYPKNGMYSIVKGMYQLATELGVAFSFNEEVQQIDLKGQSAKSVTSKNTINQLISTYQADVVIGGADYHHIETKLLPAKFRSYTEKYWDSRIMAPSCLIYYVGLNKKIKNILHHSLFFDTSFEVHGNEIYTTKEWPRNPLFYVSATSVSDTTVAPEGHENLFFLIPVATGLKNDTEEIRDQYFNAIVERMEKHLGQSILPHVVYKKSYAHSDFIADYNAFKGNAYGLANTLMQTSILKPACRSKKVKNLFYTGQLTVPGPGVPPCLISGEVVAKEVVRHFDN
jgi:phytoene desaturase